MRGSGVRVPSAPPDSQVHGADRFDHPSTTRSAPHPAAVGLLVPVVGHPVPRLRLRPAGPGPARAATPRRLSPPHDTVTANVDELPRGREAVTVDLARVGTDFVRVLDRI